MHPSGMSQPIPEQTTEARKAKWRSFPALLVFLLGAIFLLYLFYKAFAR
jgi:hypothetical protein